MPSQGREMTIDLTPSWGEFGLLYARFAEGGECNAVRRLRDTLGDGLAAAEALKSISDTLSPEQAAICRQVIAQERAKVCGPVTGSATEKV